MKDVAIVGYCRTGITRAQRGALNQTHGIPLAAHVLRNVIERAKLEPDEVEDVVLGCGQLAAVAPEEMSIAITPAVRKLLKHHGVAQADVDLWELHEAFAVTTLYNQTQLETPWETTNVNGGAVPLGHPYGMSGVRYVGSALMELARREKRRAAVAVCTAGGMATAALLERV